MPHGVSSSIPSLHPIMHQLKFGKAGLMLLLLVLFVTTTANAQKDEIKNVIIQRLEKHNILAPQEKVHLQLDKNIYTAGDTLWFAGYVVNAIKNWPSEISHTLHVDLINHKNKILTSFQLPVNLGFTDGNIPLPDSLSEGYYSIRAYTNLMRNADPDFFFNNDFFVVHPEENQPLKAKPTEPLTSNYDIQFFPESGHLVNGLTSAIAFKAIDQCGKGVAISGYLLDDKQKNITEFNTGYAGMGAFQLKPVAGTNYIAVVKLPDGKERKIQLPATQKSGYLITANNDHKDSLFVTLKATADLVNKETITFIPLSNGVPLFYMETRFPDQQINISIPKNKMPDGILQLSLLNAKNEPIAERLVFNPPAKVVKINATGIKSTYKKREKAEIELLTTDATGKALNGSFSVAIVNMNHLDDENKQKSIFSNLLLHADLKGYIEDPNGYFTNPTDDKNKALDNLMLTQGWSRFQWKDIEENNYPEKTYPIENKITISGHISTKSKAEIKGINVTLLAGELISGALLDTITNNEGHFVFNLSDSLKNLPIRLQVKGKKGIEYEINLDQYKAAESTQRSPASQNASPNTATENYKTILAQNTSNLPAHKSMFNNAIKLKDVEIRDYNPSPKLVNSHSANLNGPGQADKIILPETLEKMIDLSTLDVLLPGVRKNGAGFRLSSSAGMAHTPDIKILIDGTDMRGEISPREIESIEFLKSPEYIGIYGIRGSGGVILITTKKGVYTPYNANNQAPNSLTFNLPFQTRKEFYTPKYNQLSNKSTTMDLRSTIYWKPDLITDKNGKAIFSFYNNDVAGNYKVIIEGISVKGELCRQVYNYSVE